MAQGKQASKSTVTNTQAPKRPFKELRSGGIKCVIWQNDGGQYGPVYSTVIVRVYRDEQENWRETTSLNRDDLLLAAKLLDQAHTHIMRAEADSKGDSSLQEAA
jgi:hypothetical protein